eukprot:Skav225687  [mRNA]  locus=scaffold2526:11715:34020:- [translate_table: standard]
MFFCVAEGHVEDGDLEEATIASEGGSQCRPAGGVQGCDCTRDSLRLAVHVLRAKADEAILQEAGTKKQQVQRGLEMASLLALGQFYLMREDTGAVSDDALAVADEVGCKRLKAHVWEEMSHAYLLARGPVAHVDWVTKELQKRLRDTPSMGSALGGKINVTLSGDLAPLGVEIDESLMEEGRQPRSCAAGWEALHVTEAVPQIMATTMGPTARKVQFSEPSSLSAKVMADAVFLAMREAHNASLELSRTAVDNGWTGARETRCGATEDRTVKVLQGNGCASMPGMPSGGGFPSPPKAPAPPPMEFDPAGLGPRIVD